MRPCRTPSNRTRGVPTALRLDLWALGFGAFVDGGAASSLELAAVLVSDFGKSGLFVFLFLDPAGFLGFSPRFMTLRLLRVTRLFVCFLPFFPLPFPFPAFFLPFLSNLDWLVRMFACI